MALGGAFKAGHALGDDGAGDDEFGAAVALEAADVQGVFDLLQVVAVDGAGIPALGAEAGGDVIDLRHFDRRVESDAVGVVDQHEVVELERTGNSGRFAADALLDAAVAGQAVDRLVEDFMLGRVEARGGVLGRDGKAHGVGDALTERARGAFHSRAAVVFGVSGCARALGTEGADVAHAHVKAAQVQPSVEEHGAVAA